MDDKSNITARCGHACVIFEGSMYVFGGATANKTLFNDIWRLDLSSRVWERIVSSGSPPLPKTNAAITVYDNKFLVHGGQSLTTRRQISFHQDFQLFDDVRQFDPKTKTWTRIETKSRGPKLSWHSSLLVRKDMILMFGGLTVTEENNTIHPSNQVHVLDMISRTWKTIKPRNPSVVPPPRFGHSLIHIDDHDRSSLLLLGGSGSNGNVLNDVWTLKLCGNDECIWSPVILKSGIQSHPVLHLNPVIRLNANSLLVLNYKETGTSNLMLNTIDISTLKSFGFVRWVSSFTRSTSVIQNIGLYSLLKGCNEIVVFGGMSFSITSLVTNNLLFLEYEKFVI
jgi:hypothetical protein